VIGKQQDTTRERREIGARVGKGTRRVVWVLDGMGGSTLPEKGECDKKRLRKREARRGVEMEG
jgi:hypothetical protein